MLPICFMFFYIFVVLSNERICRKFAEQISHVFPRRVHFWVLMIICTYRSDTR